MFNLYNELTELDNKRIYNYITSWGLRDGRYIGNPEYLKFWAKEKVKLYTMLGKNLIYKVPYTYEKPFKQITKELYSLNNDANSFPDLYCNFLRSRLEDFPEIRYDLQDLSEAPVIAHEKVYRTTKFQAPGKKLLQIQEGAKPIRAIQKVLNYFDAPQELKNAFEEYRITVSMIFNEKLIHGKLCFSIHPLDFLTMSDNNSDWSSCMSWVEEGCYHIGTVEMMNSNNVICVYLESENSKYNFSIKENKKATHEGEEWTWNNKKWRQLFYCTKEIIVSGKSYPYYNEGFTKKALEVLQDLAYRNCNRVYKFGPELYKDMIHITTEEKMNTNKMWARNRAESKKHNIIFDTNGMYNDMFNDNFYNYWCVRNKVKHNIVINYSGKAPCLCCMSSVIEEADEYDSDWEDRQDAYNGRFKNVGNVICFSCKEDLYCEKCDDNTREKVYVLPNGKRFCKDCLGMYVRLCPDCGKPFLADEDNGDNFLKIRIKDKPQFMGYKGYYYKDFSNWGCDIEKKEISASSYLCCSSCMEKLKQKDLFIETKISNEKSTLWWMNSTRKYWVSKEFHSIDEPDVMRHRFENLKEVDFASL